MKKLFFIVLALTVLLTLGSCKFFDSLFYVAASVSPKDLNGYSGTTPTSRDEALLAIGNAGLFAIEGALMHVLASDAFASEFDTSSMAAFSYLPTAKLLAPVINTLQSQVGAKTITVSHSGFDGTTTNHEGHIDIENETVDLSAAKMTGTMTIDQFKADLTATTTALNPPFDVDGDAEVTLEMNGSNITDGTDTVNSAVINGKAKGTATVVGINNSTPPSSAEYDLSASIKAGFSVTSSTDKMSGKFIIETSYYDTGSLTQDQMNGPEDISNIKFTVTIKVYDNSNKELASYELDQDDAATYLNGLSGS